MSRMEQAAARKNEARHAAAELKQSLRDVGGQIREAAAETFEHLRDQAQQYYQQNRDRALEWEQSIEQYVRQKPIRSLLIAAGVGMLIGILWKRR